jgi:NDP-sugar pyrophosphorylase family protein
MSVTTARPEPLTHPRSRLHGGDRLLQAAGFETSRRNLSKRMQIEGIVLAGVHSWGYSALDHFVSWPIVPIAGQPLIVHTIKWLATAGIRTASVCANSDTVIVSKALRKWGGNSVNLHYYEDRMPRGPAGCIGDVMRDRGAPLYVVVDGSVLPQIDLAALLRAHEESGAAVTVAAVSAGGGLLSSQKLSPAGVYVFSRAVEEHIGRSGYQDVKEKLIPRLHAQGLSVATHVIDGCLLPRVRCAASYLMASKWAMESLSREDGLPPEYEVKEDSRVHRTARVDPTARLIGPVLIDADCIVEPGAVIVGPTTIGRATRIGRDSVVSRSAVWSFCRLGDRVIVDDCVVVDQACIEDGAVQRNAVCVDRTRRHSRENR